jgi:hypothetical protein
MSKELTDKNINEIFKDCLFVQGELAGDTRDEQLESAKKLGVFVSGVTTDFALHKERLESYRQDIVSMIKELHDNFKKSGGGGWSFLNLCETKTGKQWTDYHRTMEEFCVLALGLDLANWLMPKEFWSRLPGQMPYIVFDDIKE